MYPLVQFFPKYAPQNTRPQGFLEDKKKIWSNKFGKHDFISTS